MDRDVVIIGAGGHGRVVADIVSASGDKVLGFLDDNTEADGSPGDIPLLGCIDDFVNYKKSSFVIAIGDATIREYIACKLKNVNWYTAIHPSAIISETNVNIEEGTVIMPGVIMNSGAFVGKHCIVNSGAIVEHDNYIDDFAHISVGARLAGTVHVGKKTWIGIGATVSNNVFICDQCTIGAGAVVLRDIEEPGTYVGVPAKRVENKSTEIGVKNR